LAALPLVSARFSTLSAGMQVLHGFYLAGDRDTPMRPTKVDKQKLASLHHIQEPTMLLYVAAFPSASRSDNTVALSSNSCT
jgi:hypothetical protein